MWIWIANARMCIRCAGIWCWSYEWWWRGQHCMGHLNCGINMAVRAKICIMHIIYVLGGGGYRGGRRNGKKFLWCTVKPEFLCSYKIDMATQIKYNDQECKQSHDWMGYALLCFSHRQDELSSPWRKAIPRSHEADGEVLGCTPLADPADSPSSYRR